MQNITRNNLNHNTYLQINQFRNNYLFLAKIQNIEL